MPNWVHKWKDIKKENILILLLGGILLLVIALPVQEEDSGNAAEQVVETDPDDGGGADQTRALEQRLEDILAQVEGLGMVRVMLTLKSDGKRIVEKDTSRTDSADSDASDGTEKSSSQSSVQESTVFEKDASGSEQPFVSEELEPEIAGVLVIAQGAADAEKCAEITEAVMALFDVPAHKIKVMKME